MDANHSGMMLCLPDGRAFRTHASTSVAVPCTSHRENWHHKWPWVERFLSSKKLVSTVDKTICDRGSLLHMNSDRALATFTLLPFTNVARYM